MLCVWCLQKMFIDNMNNAQLSDVAARSDLTPKGISGSLVKHSPRQSAHTGIIFLPSLL